MVCKGGIEKLKRKHIIKDGAECDINTAIFVIIFLSFSPGQMLLGYGVDTELWSTISLFFFLSFVE